MSLARFLAGRLVKGALVLVAIAALNFFLIRAAPGDPATVMAGEAGAADEVFLQQLRQRFGLDRPLLEQLWIYLQGVLTLDLGFSYRQQRPVSDLILERLPATLLLMTASLSFAFAAGMALGVVAARRVNRWPDTLISTLGLVFYATPSFWFGLMAIVVFSVHLQWLPAGGFGDVAMGYTGWEAALDIARHLVLPTLTLGLIFLAIYLRIMRASMLEVLSLDFVRTARAKGLTETRVVARHVLRNAMLPMVTLIGLQAGTMLGGSVVVESVFALPGLGRLAYESVVQRDLNTLLGIVFVSALLVIAVNFVVDLLYARLDPRILSGR